MTLLEEKLQQSLKTKIGKQLPVSVVSNHSNETAASLGDKYSRTCALLTQMLAANRIQTRVVWNWGSKTIFPKWRRSTLTKLRTSSKFFLTLSQMSGGNYWTTSWWMRTEKCLSKDIWRGLNNSTQLSLMRTVTSLMANTTHDRTTLWDQTRTSALMNRINKHLWLKECSRKQIWEIIWSTFSRWTSVTLTTRFWIDSIYPFIWKMMMWSRYKNLLMRVHLTGICLQWKQEIWSQPKLWVPNSTLKR
jgi:hypothetical protein